LVEDDEVDVMNVKEHSQNIQVNVVEMALRDMLRGSIVP
jgi:hypothetical protein